jgi:hypothetical protein
MKTLIIAILCCTAFVITERSASAIRIVNETRTETPLNAVITGDFGGYSPGVIFMVHPDGVRESYPLDVSQENMKLVTRMHLKQKVRFTVRQGKVVNVEEVSR